MGIYRKNSSLPLNAVPLEIMDSILWEMYSLVKAKEIPEDYPVESFRVSQALDRKAEEMLPQYRSLSEEGLLKISPICNPPLLYLTRTGLARVRRLSQP